MFSHYNASPFRSTLAVAFSSDVLENIISRLHPRHFNLQSLPMRNISHSLLLQGCGLRIVTTSPTSYLNKKYFPAILRPHSYRNSVITTIVLKRINVLISFVLKNLPYSSSLKISMLKEYHSITYKNTLRTLSYRSIII